MAYQNFTPETLKKVIGSSEKNVIILDFWADWCMPCKVFSPIFERVSEKYPNVVFGKVDIEDPANSDLNQAFQIRSIPTLAVIVDGEVVSTRAGALKEQELTAVVESALQVG